METFYHRRTPQRLEPSSLRRHHHHRRRRSPREEEEEEEYTRLLFLLLQRLSSSSSSSSDFDTHLNALGLSLSHSKKQKHSSRKNSSCETDDARWNKVTTFCRLYTSQTETTHLCSLLLHTGDKKLKKTRRKKNQLSSQFSRLGSNPNLCHFIQKRAFFSSFPFVCVASED